MKNFFSKITKYKFFLLIVYLKYKYLKDQKIKHQATFFNVKYVLIPSGILSCTRFEVDIIGTKIYVQVIDKIFLILREHTYFFNHVKTHRVDLTPCNFESSTIYRHSIKKMNNPFYFLLIFE